MTGTETPRSAGSAGLVPGHVGGLLLIGPAWAAGLVIEALVDLPAPIAGLVVLAAALLVSPRGIEAVGPTADLAIRWLPLLFVPLAVSGASVLAASQPAALLVAVAVSVPAGFAVIARLAR